MNIAICDDDSVFRNFLEKNLRTYFDERSVPLNIIQFSSGEALLGHDLLFDLVFLDVEMGEINGIDTGKAHKTTLSDNLFEVLDSRGRAVCALRHRGI